MMIMIRESILIMMSTYNHGSRLIRKNTADQNRMRMMMIGWLEMRVSTVLNIALVISY